MTVPAKTQAQVPADPGDIMEALIIKGDLAKLTPEQRAKYYVQVCRTLGLNPYTKPFDYIVLNGELRLYPNRTCGDQLRKVHSVSLEVVSRDLANDILTVHVRARMPDGRIDEDIGCVAISPQMRADLRSNAEMRAVTKGKRRVTLSICGLGWPDESEIEDIPASAKKPAPPGVNVMLPPHDPQTGEIIEGSPQAPVTASPTEPAAPGAPPETALPVGQSGAPEVPQEQAETPREKSETELLAEYDAELAKAAATGDEVALRATWKLIPKAYQEVLKSALEKRHKPACYAAAAAYLKN